MKKTLLYIGIALVALWFSFYTENLTEKKKREEMKELKPEELVDRLMRDSLESLKERAVAFDEFLERHDDETFVKQHGRFLGIGSPAFFVVKGQCGNVRVENDEIHAGVGDVSLTIPLRHVFGNTAREASGWFNIDDFQNTMDFNAVSAALNAYIADKCKQYKQRDSVEFVGAIAVEKGKRENSFKLIPYILR